MLWPTYEIGLVKATDQVFVRLIERKQKVIVKFEPIAKTTVFNTGLFQSSVTIGQLKARDCRRKGLIGGLRYSK